MRHVTPILMALALVAAACGGGAPASPTPATSVVFTADLKTSNEVPPITNADSTGSGKATVTFDLTRDSAGKITAATAKFEIVLQGFPATTSIILSHIHQAPAGQNGGVKVDTGLKADQPIDLTTGGTTINKSGINVDPALAEQILNDPAGFYQNVHSKLNPGGVVRGQLVKK